MGQLLTGRRMTAATAHRYGLVNEVVPVGLLDDCVAEWTAALIASAPLSVRAIKESVLRSLDMPLEDAFAHRYPWRSGAGTAGTRSKGRARSRKRDPVWSGR